MLCVSCYSIAADEAPLWPAPPTADDMESDKVHLSGIIVRDLALKVSNYRAQVSLSDYLKEKGVVGISGVDTREVTRRLRSTGCLNGIITTDMDTPVADLVAKTKEWSILGKDLISEVTCSKKYEWSEGTCEEWEAGLVLKAKANRGESATPFHVRTGLCRKSHYPLTDCVSNGPSLKLTGAHTSVGTSPDFLSIARHLSLPGSWEFLWLWKYQQWPPSYSSISTPRGPWGFGQLSCRGSFLSLQVVAYDFGIKTNILRRLASYGCRITVVPANTPAEDVLAMNPDGVFFSNGPVRISLISFRFPRRPAGLPLGPALTSCQTLRICSLLSAGGAPHNHRWSIPAGVMIYPTLQSSPPVVLHDRLESADG